MRAIPNILKFPAKVVVGDVHLMERKLWWQLHRCAFAARCRLRTSSGRARWLEKGLAGSDRWRCSDGAVPVSVLTAGIPAADGGAVLAGEWDLDGTPLAVASACGAGGSETPSVPEVRAALGRDGGVLIDSESAGRLSAAAAAGQTAFDVEVVCRHRSWAEFRKELYLYSRLSAKGCYQPLLHPDLSGIPQHRGEERWDMMAAHLPFESGSLLDIGSNLGFFCHCFEGVGFDCTAAETNFMYRHFMRRLRRAQGKSFQIVAGSVFELDAPRYDIVLALSIFHHFLREPALFELLKAFLRRLDVGAMFFEPHETGKGFAGAHVDFSEQEFVDFVLEHSGLTHSEFLGRCRRGRPLYLLSR